MKLILHIGTEKTGTTAIQKFLTSKKNLHNLDLSTPESQGVGNHSYFAAYALNSSSKDIALTMRGLDNNPDAHREFRNLIAQEFIKDLKSSKNNDFIITSEDFQRLYNHDEIARLQELLSPYFDEVQILLFVRRQDELASSRHGMLVRDGYRDRFSLSSINGLTRENFYNYKALYNRWKTHFPDAEITVIPYGSNSLNRGKDSIELFLEAIGKSTEHYTSAVRANLSLTPARYRFYQIMRNRMNWKISYKDASPLLNSLPLLDLDKVIPSKKKHAKEFLKLFEETNFWISENTGIQDLFSNDLSMYEDDFIWDEFDKDILARVASSACLTKLA